jgi:hypothetical protein
MTSAGAGSFPARTRKSCCWLRRNDFSTPTERSGHFREIRLIRVPSFDLRATYAVTQIRTETMTRKIANTRFATTGSSCCMATAPM